MSRERSIASQQQQLERIPAEFRPLIEWGWGELRAAFAKTVQTFGVDPLTASTIAARVARLAVAQIVTEIKHYREFARSGRN